MAQRTKTRVEWVTDEELLAEIEPQLVAFERRYGQPSSTLVEAFRTDGELVETDDFLTWEFRYTTWLNSGGPAR